MGWNICQTDGVAKSLLMALRPLPCLPQQQKAVKVVGVYILCFQTLENRRLTGMLVKTDGRQNHGDSKRISGCQREGGIDE